MRLLSQLQKWVCLLCVLGMSIAPCEELPPGKAPTEVPSLPEEPSTSAEATPSYEKAFIKMFSTLFTLLILIVATVWLLKRFAQGKFRSFGGKGSIQIVSRCALSPKSMLYLVEIEGKRVLIAESQLEVRRLIEIEKSLEQ